MAICLRCFTSSRAAARFALELPFLEAEQAIKQVANPYGDHTIDRPVAQASPDLQRYIPE